MGPGAAGCTGTTAVPHSLWCSCLQASAWEVSAHGPDVADVHSLASDATLRTTWDRGLRSPRAPRPTSSVRTAHLLLFPAFLRPPRPPEPLRPARFHGSTVLAENSDPGNTRRHPPRLHPQTVPRAQPVHSTFPGGAAQCLGASAQLASQGASSAVGHRAWCRGWSGRHGRSSALAPSSSGISKTFSARGKRGDGLP